MRPPYRIDRAEVIATELLIAIKQYKDAKAQTRVGVQEEGGPSSGVFDTAKRWVRKQMHSDVETKDDKIDTLEATLQSLLTAIKEAEKGVDFKTMQYDAQGNDKVIVSKEFLETLESLLEMKTGSPTLDGTGEGSLRGRYMKADENYMTLIKTVSADNIVGYSDQMANKFNPPERKQYSPTM